MRHRYVVDTNVLIAASAVDTDSALAGEATPSDPELRQKVWVWLNSFRKDISHLVLDGQGGIAKEYNRNVGFNDFGRQVIIHKYSTSAVDLVDVLYDGNGDGLLDEPLQTVVHHSDDRKMVAAALDAMNSHGQCAIAFAAESDWHGWEADLVAAGLDLEPIIPEWSRAKYLEKSGS